jgi:tRNA(Ile)-lysidine synthase TilS/MesJ
MKEKVIFCWSGGKDSALALYELNKNDEYKIHVKAQAS